MCEAEPLVDARAVAEVLGVSARSVLRSFERGQIPGYRVSPRRIRFRLEEVLGSLRA